MTTWASPVPIGTKGSRFERAVGSPNAPQPLFVRCCGVAANDLQAFDCTMGVYGQTHEGYCRICGSSVGWYSCDIPLTLPCTYCCMSGGLSQGNCGVSLELYCCFRDTGNTSDHVSCPACYQHVHVALSDALQDVRHTRSSARCVACIVSATQR